MLIMVLQSEKVEMVERVFHLQSQVQVLHVVAAVVVVLDYLVSL